jgi:hypothetical protein
MTPRAPRRGSAGSSIARWSATVRRKRVPRASRAARFALPPSAAIIAAAQRTVSRTSGLTGLVYMDLRGRELQSAVEDMRATVARDVKLPSGYSAPACPVRRESAVQRPGIELLRPAFFAFLAARFSSAGPAHKRSLLIDDNVSLRRRLYWYEPCFGSFARHS